MDISIKNCNNIDNATIHLDKGFLNIKYGINGTGKSTIAKAIELNSQDPEKLVELTPFKLIEDNPNDLKPVVEGCDGIGSVAVFNEFYVGKFVFKQDELIKNSFEIFVKTPDYQQKLDEIEGIVVDIKQTFKKNEEIDQVINDLAELGGCFGNARSGYSKTSSIGKGFGGGNKIDNIPAGFESYTEFLQSDQNTNWIKWHINGNSFLELSDNCPYCTSPAKEKHDDIKKVSDTFDAKSIEHLTKVLSVVERLAQYFSEDTRNQLSRITRNKTGLTKEDITYLKQIKEQIDTLRDKMKQLQHITFFPFEDVDKVVEAITQLKINLASLPFLGSDETKAIVDKLNDSLDTVLNMGSRLQGAVNKQKKLIQSTVKKRKQEINNFLHNAGYKYTVDIESDAQQYKLKLQHHDLSNTTVEGGSQHLSYGEKNAFALVLFMYECIANSPGLIVLDDPISSFDKNKKYALLHMLFTGAVSLRRKTVLMLTHDLEPIIDLIRTLSNTFSSPKPKAYFLKAMRGGVNETEITKNDIQTFAQICNGNISGNEEVVIKLIYLRRYFETVDDRGSEYQLLSSLLHKRSIPIDKSGDADVEMSDEAITEASNSVKKKIDEFDYEALLNRLRDVDEMKKIYKHCRSGYEKLQIFRVICNNHKDSVFRKYINESFHIENEYICQLNPSNYEVIPEFIVAECDKYFENDV